MFKSKKLQEQIDFLQKQVEDLSVEVARLRAASITKVGKLSEYEEHHYNMSYRYRQSWKDPRPEMTSVEMIERICNHLNITFERRPEKNIPASIALVSTKENKNGEHFTSKG